MASKPEYGPGDTIRGESGDYVVGAHLGSGGMASAYRVKDKNLGRTFVIKILHRRLATREAFRQRHHHEARAIGQLAPHPGIVEVFSLSWTRDADRVPYYVMEFLDGETLFHAMENTKNPILLPQALGIGVKLLAVLDHAHTRGVMHRDVKPENIFIYGDGGLKLLDWGILRLIVDKGEDAGVFIGTPRYAAPEQLRGGEVTSAADLYAVGVVLYTLLTDLHPFEGHGHKLEELVETLILPAPSLATHGDFPTDLVELVDSALAKEPAGRPRDAFSFASRLHEIHKRIVREAARDPHRAPTVEARIQQPREPSQVTQAKLADATNEDLNQARLMQAISNEKDQRDIAEAPSTVPEKLTGYESTAEEKAAHHALPLVVTQPAAVASPPAGAPSAASQSGVDRAALTAAPATPAGGMGPGSVQYLSQESPRAPDVVSPSAPRAAGKVQYTAPILPRKPAQIHWTVPMAGRPTREPATPEPHALVAREAPETTRGVSRHASPFRRLQQLIEPRALPVAVAVAGLIVAAVFVFGGMGNTSRGAKPSIAQAGASPISRTVEPASSTSVATPAPTTIALALATSSVSSVQPQLEASSAPSPPVSAHAPRTLPATSGRAVPARMPAGPSKSRSPSPSDVKFE